MAYISFKPSDYFATKTYTGNGSTQTITTGLANDMVWLKGRSFIDNHIIFDSVRGVNKKIVPDNDAIEGTAVAPNLGVTAFNSTGFDLGAWGAVNGNTETFASWNWRMGTTTGKPTVGETITPSSYSINTTAKQGIYKYTGTGSTGSIAHGLGVTPKLIIVKQLNTTRNWCVNNIDNPSGIDGLLYLNDNSPVNADASGFDLSSSTTITFNTHTLVNESGGTYVCYVFSPVAGYSSYGAYTGNGIVDGTFVYTGFRPAFIILKSVTGSGDGWFMANNKSNPFNRVNKNLFANTTGQESTNGTAAGDKNLDFLANGFKIRTTNSECNSSGVNYMYMAWAENPIIGSNGTVGVAR